MNKFFRLSILASTMLLTRNNIFPENKDQFQSKQVHNQNYTLISGNSNRPLATQIAALLGKELGKCQINRFVDGEIKMKIEDNVRGKDVYVIQSTSPPVNEHLMELLLLIATLRRSAAKRITAVIPYYGYARQDRRWTGARVPVSASDVADLIEIMGVDRVITCDLHSGQISGFFGPKIPVDNLEASILAVDYFMELQLQNLVIVSPDAGGVYRAKKFQEQIRKRGQEAKLAMIIKQRASAGVVERVDLIGDVDGCDCIIIDDMIDTAGTLCEVAKELKLRKAKKVYAFATHGLFSGNGIEKIENSQLEKVIVTNSIPMQLSNEDTSIYELFKQKKKTQKIVQISIAKLLAETINRMENKESILEIYK